MLPRNRRLENAGLFPAVILIVNLLIAWKLFSVEYSAYLESNEGTFIAIARQVSLHPSDIRWWPLWDCGLPFQNTYLPLLPLITGVFSLLTGTSAALSFHRTCALFFCLGPVFLYTMAWRMTRQPGPSFLAALAWSLVSPCAWLLPLIRRDLGSAFHLRRLQILAYYGEGPHTLSIAFLPLAILFLYLSLAERKPWMKIAAGLFLGATVLANAFGAVILAMVAVSLLATIETKRFWRNLGLLAAISAFAYCWISPLLPPSVISAIRMNSPTVDGDYRFTARSLGGMIALSAGFASVWWATHRMRLPVLRFFLLFTSLASGIVMLGVFARSYVVPQPHRYQIAMDMGICLVAVFGISEWLRRLRPALLIPAAILLLAAALPQLRHDVRYARRMIQSTDMTSTAPYRIARWMDEHMQGRRVMISGSYSFHFNDFTDTPQLHGGHDPMLPNFMLRIVMFTIYSGMNTGARDGEISTLWLKALGAHAISVPGPHSAEYYKPFANPRKFDGVLPVLWREGDDTIYEVPSKSASLAHVIPTRAIVRHAPINGLDTGESERYVRALDDPAMPEAPLTWWTRHSAGIQARIAPGQAVSVQVTYHPGWRATVNGAPQRVDKDGLGFLLLQPACQGACEIALTFEGGPEWRLTCLASLIAIAFGLYLIIREALARPSHIQ